MKTLWASFLHIVIYVQHPSSFTPSMERTPGQRCHDLGMHLVDQLDRLRDGIVPCFHLPSSIACLFALLQTVVSPDVLHGVQLADLTKVSCNRLDEALAGF